MRIYDIPIEFARMKPRDRWLWARNALAVQRTAWSYKRGIAACFYANGFDVTKFKVDDYGFLFGTIGEKYLFVMRHGCDNYGYIVSRFGVIRVRVWDD